MADEETAGTQTKARTRAKTQDDKSEAEGLSFEELEPTAPAASLNPVGADVSAVEVFDPDVDPLDVSITANVDYEADEVADFDGEPVTSLQTAAGPGGAVVAVNGTSYLFTATQLGTLARQVSRASSAAT
jgi:hypothetical protein